MAQLVERVLGKDEVPGSNPGSSSKTEKHPFGCFFRFRAATHCLSKRVRFRASKQKAAGGRFSRRETWSVTDFWSQAVLGEQKNDVLHESTAPKPKSVFLFLSFFIKQTVAKKTIIYYNGIVFAQIILKRSNRKNPE